MIIIYHNPRCSKSRECFNILQASGKQFKVVKYLEKPFSEKKLTALLNTLKISAIELVRQNEPIWKENYKGKVLNDQEVIQILIKHPILMERPVVINQNRAVIARPPEKVKEII